VSAACAEQAVLACPAWAVAHGLLVGGLTRRLPRAWGTSSIPNARELRAFFISIF